MARYSPEHKGRSRQRLLTAAAGLFRQHGYAGIGINDLCAAAGLTRGAFYGHFGSKAALFAAVIGGAHDFVRRLRNRPGATTRELSQQAAGVACDYLAPKNRKAVISGCSLAALAIDTSRADAGSQQAYARAVRAVIDEMRRGQHGPSTDIQSARAAIALCVGGLLINNACGADPEGKKVAKAAQREVTRLLTHAG